MSALALVLMGLMLLTLIELLAGRSYKILTVLAAIGCVLAALATFKLPMSLVQLYPSLFASLAPCFCITAVFSYVAEKRNSMKELSFTLSTMLLSLGLLCICGLVQGALLSGIDYYINFSIFRGIKLSLYVPMIYSIPAYYMIFVKENNKSIIPDAKKLLTSDVKVYWLVLVALFAFVGLVYIRRSGNVNEISAIEDAMRTFITEHFPARPRTKEFIAWPCLLLFIYYIKERRVPLASFIFAIGSSILFASVVNTFCHVFTNLLTMYTRVFVGVLFSAFICVGVYIINKLWLKLYEYGKNFNE